MMRIFVGDVGVTIVIGSISNIPLLVGLGVTLKCDMVVLKVTVVNPSSSLLLINSCLLRSGPVTVFMLLPGNLNFFFDDPSRNLRNFDLVDLDFVLSSSLKLLNFDLVDLDY